QRGDFWIIVGPNGAGKTTLLKIIATLSKPSAGAIEIDAMDPLKHRLQARKQIGFIGHQSFLYPNLSAAENLLFYARMYGLKNYDQIVTSRLEQVGLTDRRDDLVRNFSRGMQQRLTIARALLSDPSVILLDEPFSGLDQQGIDLFAQLFSSLISPESIIIMTTHNLQLGWELASHYAILSRGRLAKSGRCDATNFESFQSDYRTLTRELN
ncbi:MAG: heme ABC exporter ATP-binding protein CcmA, partial [bacterium]|nr:heme ABC exporter ATP-binding protein CcmA [bacterium]